MSDITMDEISVVVSGSSDKATDSFERLISALDRLEDTVSRAIDGVKKSGKGLDDFSNKTDKNMRKVQKIFSSAQKNILKFAAGMGIMTFSFNKSITEMSDYISAQVSFNRILGTSENNLKQATEFVNKLTNSWYLDGQEVMKATSRYFTMTRTMGMTEEASFRMSKNLTMLSYDLQLLGTTGARITEVQNQIASALRGEAEGLAKYGISLNQATLQSVLYEKGINRTVSSLTAAQKAELVYYQIMRQTAQYHGYYAEQLKGFENGLLQPAMAMQILRTQALNFARALGSVFIPMLSAALPYLIALTQLLTELAKKVAGFFGFKLEDWTIDSDGISAGFADIGASADKAGKKIKGALGDFDELHTISFPDASGALDGIGAGGSLGLDASEFEYSEKLLGVTNEKLEKAKQFLNDIKDILATIGLIIAGYKISSSLLTFLDKFGVLGKDVSIFKTAIGIGITIGSVYLLYQGISKILDGEITPESILESALGLFGLTGGVQTIASGLGITLKLGPLIPIVAGISIAISGIAVQKEGIEEGSIGKQILGSLMTGLGAGLTLGFMTGNPVIGIVAGIVISLGSFLVDSAITGKLQEFINSLTQGFSDVGSKFQENIVTPISEFFSKIANYVYTNAIEPIVSFFEPIITAISKIWSNIFKNVSEIVTTIISAIVKIITKIVEIQMKMIQIAIAIGKAIYDNIIEPFIDKLKKFANFVVEKIWKPFDEKVLKPIRDGIQKVRNFLWDLFAKFGTAVSDFIGGLIKGVVNGLFTMIENRINGFIRMLNGAINIINKIPRSKYNSSCRSSTSSI